MVKPRRCRKWDCKLPATFADKRLGWYCDRHRAEALADRRRQADSYAAGKSTKERGYSGDHRKLRAEWAPHVEAGQVRCFRAGCGRLIEPGSPWDLGHRDDDRSQWTGPEHRACNRRTAAHRAERKQPERRHREPSIAD